MTSSTATSSRLIRLALVGGIPLLLALLFLWAGGWLTPQRLSADKLVDTLQAAPGAQSGFRRNHAKGLCVIGEFTSSGRAGALSRAALFGEGTTPVTGRFAIAGGNPHAPDYAVPVRSLALEFTSPSGQQWRTGMNAMPFFPVATVQGFYDQLLASKPDPATGKPDPKKMQAFLTAHPEAKPFLAWAKQAGLSASWAVDRYNSINAFRFIDKAGQSHLVRWSMVPHQRWQPIAAEQKVDKDFLQRDLTRRLAEGPLAWDLIITLAGKGDRGDDASKAWPADRQTVNAGTLVLRRAVPQEGGPCNNINYDPLILPDGIAASDDPLLNARSSAYAKSYNRRTHEEARGAAGESL
ncbi:catalase family peroxidase [Erwinia sp. 9145]|uniref:catalase family peroxidase n=1 Tax=Erwinia sp. 9145 TaxID=1500895 RepID=UPI00054E40E1|nr:catalase family peroxidase [Erwinia sp. 9145]